MADYQPPPDIVIVQGEDEHKGSGVKLTRPDGTIIYVNPRAVAFVRAPLPGEIGNATIVFSSGAKQATLETVQQVIEAIYLDMPVMTPAEKDKEYEKGPPP